MITKTQSRNISEDIKIEIYSSEIFTIKINYTEDKINSILVYPTKYPYPDILVNKNEETYSIKIDLEKISCINVEQIETMINNLHYTKMFIQTELIPLLNKLYES